MILESITTAILASTLYDMLKHSVVLSSANLKQHLKTWALDDVRSLALEQQITKLELNDDMSESAIEKRVEGSFELIDIMKNITPNNTTTNIQLHSGSGDNVAGDKIIHHD